MFKKILWTFIITLSGLLIGLNTYYSFAYSQTIKENKYNQATCHTKNPMTNWQYNPECSDYYLNVKNGIKRTYYKYKILPSEHHFQNFPIKYWIQPTKGQYIKKVNIGIDTYKKYFPMVEVKKQDEADLIIEILSREELSKKFNTNSQTESGFGTFKLNVAINDGKTIIESRKGYVYLITDQFNKPLFRSTLLHELGHAFGLIDHSNSIQDIMYPVDLVLSSDNEKDLTALNEGGMIFHPDKLSCSDLNTLWKLYNNW